MSRNSPTQSYRDFDPLSIPEYARLVIGGGQIGGKARGLVYASEVHRRYPYEAGKRVTIPESGFLATGLFDQFMEDNGLMGQEGSWETTEQAEAAFLAGDFRPEVKTMLAGLLEEMDYPLAVRSSSLLEDSLKYSFAGKYLTTFISDRGSPAQRLERLLASIKRAYASTYGPNAVEYRRKHRLEGEKMAVIVQRLCGKQRGNMFYPAIAGVGFSRNYRRWTERIRQEDGVVRMVFGLGTRCTGREYARTFSLTNLNLRPEGFIPRDVAKYSQERLDFLDLDTSAVQTANINDRQDLIEYHPRFSYLAQVYDARTDEILEVSSVAGGLAPGQKFIFTFHNLARLDPEPFTLARYLFDILEREMGVAVDIEFTYEPADHAFSLVQARALSSYEEYRPVRVPPNIPAGCLLLRGDKMLTNGMVTSVQYLVYVDHDLYRSTPDKHTVAREVGRINRRLGGEKYILVGPGRWGSTAAEKGVPVNYNEISNAGVLIELGIRQADFAPELSYGTHFFADLAVDGTLYMPVFDTEPGNVFNRDWFDREGDLPTGHPAVKVFAGPFDVYLDGQNMIGVVVLGGSGDEQGGDSK